MKHLRTVEINESNYKLGDVIAFNMTNGEAVEALAVREDNDGTLFITVDCLAKEYQMQRNARSYTGYDASDLREDMRGEILDGFPAELRDMMVPFDNGDLLRLPTEREIFGTNEYGYDESENIEQFECMKLRRNRIAFQGKNGAWEWYWLENRSVYSASLACYVGSDGAGSNGASTSGGVRPLFKIRHR